jgi:hypothetical protein
VIPNQLLEEAKIDAVHVGKQVATGERVELLPVVKQVPLVGFEKLCHDRLVGRVF